MSVSATDEPAFRPGSKIAGRYRIEKRLGRGGMGAVFQVVDESTDTRLALKRLSLRGGRAASERDELRFRREFYTMAGLAHPLVVEVFDYGVDDHGPYYTMELLDGSDLNDLGPVEPKRACRLLRDVAAVLAFIHARRLLHRDLAPRNVRCTTDGRAKLIDFGVLASFGVCGEIAGTPPFIPPEAVHGLPLDHRTDLYGLGALAYWLLTGQHAYPARRLEQLESVWRKSPPVPSARNADVPKPLDDVVMSLLSPEPLARPSAAAEVIDRLAAIGDLAPLAGAAATRGYLASAEMVGRERETRLLRDRVDKSVEGAGRAVVIEAPSGLGKSRLLRELGLIAQLAGTTVLRADSHKEQRGAYAVIRQLAIQLLAAAPEPAVAAAEDRASILVRVVPEFRAALTAIGPAPPAAEPGEERLRVQNELADWFLEVAAALPIVMSIDDVQRCDEPSAAVLAALAHRCRDRRLLIALALRTDEEVRAPAPVAAIADAAIRVRLRGLDGEDTERLVRALFGDVPHAPRLAHWMQRIAGGSPLLCTELARHLVDREVIRFTDGQWFVPADLDSSELPRELSAAMDARIDALSPSARATAEALSIYGSAFSLDLCALVAEGRDDRELFAALDELLGEEILVGTRDSYSFRHDGLREALLRCLPEPRKAELHLRVAEALLKTDETGEGRAAVVGWHLVEGGDPQRGARFLDRGGRELYEAQAFDDAVPALEKALEVFAQQRASPKTLLELEFMLLSCGVMADRSVALRHIDAVVEGYGLYSGVTLAARLKRYVGRHVALAVAVFVASLRWLLSWPGRRGPNPVSALRTFFLGVGYSASVYSLSNDIPAVRRLVARVDPIAVFRKRMTYAFYLMTRNLLDVPLGRLATARDNAERILSIMRNDHMTPVRDTDRKMGEGAAIYTLVLLALAEQSSTYLELVAELEQLGLRFFDVAAQQAHAAFRRVRGEEQLACELEARAEVMFVQLGSVWQIEATLPLWASIAYAQSRDMLGLKRAIEALAELVDRGFCYQGFLDIARGEYLRERGQLEESEAVLREFLASEFATENQTWPVLARAALAETLLARGQLDDAANLAKVSLTMNTDEVSEGIMFRARSARVLSLALAAGGDIDGAAQRLDEAIAQLGDMDSPTTLGALHEARARVALLARDWTTFEQHRVEMEAQFRPTKNPALIARIDQLVSAGAPDRRDAIGTEVVDREAVTTPAINPKRRVSDVLSKCRDRAERAQRALELLMQATGAARGYLYLMPADGAIELAAPLYGAEPPDALVDDVRAAASTALSGQNATVVDVQRPRPRHRAWQPLVLYADAAPRPIAVGVAAMVEGAVGLLSPSQRLVAEISRGLLEAGDVSAVTAQTVSLRDRPALDHNDNP